MCLERESRSVVPKSIILFGTIITIIVFKSYYFSLFVFQNIISIIAIVSIKIIVIIAIIDIIAIIYCWSHLHTKVVYGYRYWV